MSQADPTLQPTQGTVLRTLAGAPGLGVDSGCATCGTAFVTRRRAHRYCSAKCRVAGYTAARIEARITAALAAQAARDAELRRLAEAMLRVLNGGRNSVTGVIRPRAAGIEPPADALIGR